MATRLVKPPDGGYGWVIVGVAFLINMLVDGLVTSFGVFIPHFREYFGGSIAEITTAGSLLAGFYFGIGAVAAALVNKCGCRVVAITGSLIATSAFACCRFMPNLVSFVVVYGVFGGIGFGLISLTGYVSLSYYFGRKRAIATGIASSGAGVGIMVMAPLCTKILDVYDWKNATVLLAGLFLQSAVLGALMRPLKPDISTSGENDCKHRSDTVATEDKNSDAGKSFTIDAIRNRSKRLSQSAIELNKDAYVDKSNHNKDRQHVSNDLDLINSGSVYSITLHYNSLTGVQKPKIFSEEKLNNESTSTRACGCLGENTVEVLKALADPYLLKDVRFLAISFANLLILLGYYVPFIFVFELANGMNLSTADASIIVFAMGVASIAGRIIVGAIASHTRLNIIFLHDSTVFLAGVAVLVIPSCPNYVTLLVASSCYTLFGSCFIPLTTTVLVENFGLCKLTNAFGFLTMVRGISTMVGSPLAGFVIESTGQTSSGFYFSGVLFLLAAILHSLVYFVHKKLKGKCGQRQDLVVLNVD